MPTPKNDPGIPKDPFKRAIYVFYKLTDLISQDQLISKTFLTPKRALTDIYADRGFRQLADDIFKSFAVRLTDAEIRKAETLEGLTLAIIAKLPAT
jgi:hypothetical protein